MSVVYLLFVFLFVQQLVVFFHSSRVDVGDFPPDLEFEVAGIELVGSELLPNALGLLAQVDDHRADAFASLDRLFWNDRSVQREVQIELYWSLGLDAQTVEVEIVLLQGQVLAPQVQASWTVKSVRKLHVEQNVSEVLGPSKDWRNSIQI